jgi:hypothetical protein
MMTPKMIFREITLMMMKNVSSYMFFAKNLSPRGSGFIESPIPPPFLKPWFTM